MKAFLDKFCRVAYVIVFSTIVAVGVLSVLPKYRHSRSLEGELRHLRLKMEAKKSEIAAVCDRQRRFQTDRDFVESLARENRLVFPDELVFTFEN